MINHIINRRTKVERLFDIWWRREEAGGLALTDPFEVAVIHAVAEAAYKAAWRKKTAKKKVKGVLLEEL